MYPFIHIGPVTLGTYGIMVAAGLICGFFVLRADLARRKIAADAEAIIGITGLSGLAGSRVYNLLEPENLRSTREAFASHPWSLIFSATGFAWFGAVIGGFIALWFLARSFKLPLLLMLDVASPAAAVGYGVGRIGCLISGDGDYGVPTSLPWGMSFLNGIESSANTCLMHGLPPDCRVHPTPIYEFLAALAIFWILWSLGGRLIKIHAAWGMIFAAYLVLTGLARFLVEFIRLNPHMPIYFGLTNAQAASVGCMILGAVLWLSRRSAPLPRPTRGRVA